MTTPRPPLREEKQVGKGKEKGEEKGKEGKKGKGKGKKVKGKGKGREGLIFFPRERGRFEFFSLGDGKGN